MTKIERLTERVEALQPTPKSDEATMDQCKRILAYLTEDEQIALAKIIYAADMAEVRPIDEAAWLAARPQEEQALVAKVTGLFREQEPLP